MENLPASDQTQLQHILQPQEQKTPEDATNHEEHVLDSMEEAKAAGTIQRNYRGYRQRRQMNGLGLDASTRWTEAIKEAQYQKLIRPLSRIESTSPNRLGKVTSTANRHWRKAGHIVRRAGADDESDLSDLEELPETDRKLIKERRRLAKAEREKHAKQMDLNYFLEMVDRKHRYGSNLRHYHAEWKKAETNENFFYWLDYGEGRNLSLESRPRERLDREQVRYLSREERLHYLVKIDKKGRFCWARNGARIDTSEEWRDSIHGIVPLHDTTPKFKGYPHDDNDDASSISSSSSENSSASSILSSDSSDREAAEHYTNNELHNAHGIDKIKQVSAATVLNHLLRKTTKKNTWIFVADTSFRLYVGLKQSGSFQHSSFLNGSRISAAGLIKIRNGQLRSLSPLSGHYRPPTKNFTVFVKSLKEEGVDMSRVSISKSYAVLVGLETYKKSKSRVQLAGEKVKEGGEMIVSPEKVKQRKEAARDKSKSAERERLYLEELARSKKDRKRSSLSERLKRKLRLGHGLDAEP